jgi:Pyruvate/2-oxoacid:ferredoxin oxidoreductase delta subunit/predicted transcriptional regulator
LAIRSGVLGTEHRGYGVVYCEGHGTGAHVEQVRAAENDEDQRPLQAWRAAVKAERTGPSGKESAMAHKTLDTDLAYHRLQQRLDRMVTGAPDSPALQAILRLLFTPEEAELAARMPTMCSLHSLAERVGRDEAALDALVTSMARRGLVVDLEHRGERWVMLAPVVIGFFEYTFMRVRTDAPMEQLAKLFDEYMYGDPDREFGHAVFRGSVQIGRSMVREEAIRDEPGVEVLDWERATSVISSARSVAVALCPCRYHAQLSGRGCGAPLRTCLSFNAAADALVRMGLADPISNAEGLEVLKEAKQAGLAQTADNVQRDVTYMCNCCGCCCGMMQAIRGVGITNAIVSSNWVAETDFSNCRGCKKCFHRCPAEAITMVDNDGKGRRKYWSVVDPQKCLGCGVCTDVCRWEGRYMVPRPHRVFTPQTTLDRIIAMAVERGKLGDLLVDTLTGTGPHAMAQVLQILEQTPPAAAVRAVEPLRSVFLRGLLAVLHAGMPANVVQSG